MRIGKVHLHTGLRCDLAMTSHFTALVMRHGLQ